MKTKQKTRKQLEHEIKVLKASTPVNLHFSKKDIDKLSTSHYMASGLVITITDLSGNIKTEVMIQDGLDQGLIESLKQNIDRALGITLSYVSTKK